MYMIDVISVNGTCNGEEDEDSELYDDIEIGAPRTGRLLDIKAVGN